MSLSSIVAAAEADFKKALAEAPVVVNWLAGAFSKLGKAAPSIEAIEGVVAPGLVGITQLSATALAGVAAAMKSIVSKNADGSVTLTVSAETAAAAATAATQLDAVVASTKAIPASVTAAATASK